MFMSGDVGPAAYQVPVAAWSVYSHPMGQATKIDACKGGFWYSTASNTVPTFPTALGAFSNPYNGCRYEGPATGPGSVTCLDMSSWKTCSTATASSAVCDDGQGLDQFFAQVECEF